MRWEDLQPGDQLMPLTNYATSYAHDPAVVISVTVRENDGAQVSPFGQRDVVELLFLNTRTAKTFKETRYTSGSAGLGFEIIRDGQRIA